MVRLVEMVAPRTPGEAVLKALAFLALINAFNYALTTSLRGGSFHLVHDLLNTTLVALPFVVLIIAILTHQRRLQHQLMLLATTDMLTGLPNRRAFLARAAELRDRAPGPGAFLILDADHFKRINDTWGHGAGDACLAAIGERMRAALAPGDVAGRLGGEEFAAFLPGATRERAAALGERLCRTIAVEAEGAGEALRVTLSAGATMATGATPLAHLMAEADAALYRAKAEGRARVVFWSEPEARRDEAA